MNHSVARKHLKQVLVVENTIYAATDENPTRNLRSLSSMGTHDSPDSCSSHIEQIEKLTLEKNAAKSLSTAVQVCCTEHNSSIFEGNPGFATFASQVFESVKEVFLECSMKWLTSYHGQRLTR